MQMFSRKQDSIWWALRFMCVSYNLLISLPISRYLVLSLSNKGNYLSTLPCLSQTPGSDIIDTRQMVPLDKRGLGGITAGWELSTRHLSTEHLNDLFTFSESCRFKARQCGGVESHEVVVLDKAVTVSWTPNKLNVIKALSVIAFGPKCGKGPKFNNF